MTAIDFGDTVRVRSTPETESAGLAHLVGPVYGVTTPSVTGVSVVGAGTEDRAINVFFEARGEAVWLAPHLLEFVDDGAGAVVEIKGAPQRWVRTADGAWVEEPSGRRTPDLFQRFTQLFTKLFR
jgi:hypothetical protein